MSDGVLPVRWKDGKLNIARFHFMCFYRLPSAAFALVLKQIIVLDNSFGLDNNSRNKYNNNF